MQKDLNEYDDEEYYYSLSWKGREELREKKNQKRLEEVEGVIETIKARDDLITLSRAILFSSLIIREGLERLNKNLKEKGNDNSEIND